MNVKVSTNSNFVEYDSWYFIIHSCDYQKSISYQAIYRGAIQKFERTLINAGFGYGMLKEDAHLIIDGVFKGLKVYSRDFINKSFIITKKCEFNMNCNNPLQGLNKYTLLCENCINNCETCEFYDICNSCMPNYFLNPKKDSLVRGNCNLSCPFNHIKDNSTYFIAESMNSLNFIDDNYRVFNNLNKILIIDKIGFRKVKFPIRKFFLK